MYHEAKYSPHSAKAERIAMRGEPPRCKILSNVRTPCSRDLSKIKLYVDGPWVDKKGIDGIEFCCGRYRVMDGAGAPSPEHAAYLPTAASSISLATSVGCDVITTCEAPSMTTVFLEPARLAMKSIAAAGIFLSALP